MTDVKDLLKILGDDYPLVNHVDAKYFAYIAENPDSFKKLIRNLRYNAKYLIGMNEVQREEYVISQLNPAFVASESVNKWLQKHA